MTKDISIAVAIRSFGEYDRSPLDLLTEKGFDLTVNSSGRRLEGTELAEFIRTSDGIIAGTEKYTSDVLNGTRKIKVISRVGIGLDNIDLAFAHSRDIAVVNTPESPSTAVAEHAMALMLSSLKRIAAYDARVRKKDWRPLKGYLLRDKTVGIIGLGRIGKKVAGMAAPFGCNVIAYDPYIGDGAPPDVIMKDRLEDLLAISDIITLHVPLTDMNYHLISKKHLEILKPGAFIVNTSRGEILDEAALLKGLSEEKISGAALDVFEKEPYSGPLLDMESVTLTPHVSSNVVETRIEMEIEAAKNLILYFENGCGA